MEDRKSRNVLFEYTPSAINEGRTYVTLFTNNVLFTSLGFIWPNWYLYFDGTTHHYVDKSTSS